MAISIPIPPYLAAAQAPTGLSALVGGAEQGIGALQAIRQRELQQQALQQQMATQQIAQQAARERLGALPAQLAAEQQRRELAITHDVQENSHLRRQLAMDALNADQAGHVMMSRRMADLALAPPEMKEQKYQDIKSELNSIGYDTSKMPQNYDKRVEHSAQIFLYHSPESAVARQHEFEIGKMKLQQAGQLALAQAKAAIAPGMTMKAFEQAEGKKNSDFFTDTQNNAAKAEPILNDVKVLKGIGGQIPEQFGKVRGYMMNLTPKGQALMSENNKLIIDRFSQMPHIGRGGNLLLRTIKGEKPGPNMSYAAFMQRINRYETAASFLVEKNKFSNYMKSLGILDRNKIQSIWDDFTTLYSPIDAQGNPHPQRPSRWMEFLQNHPHLIGRALPAGAQPPTATPVPGAQPAAPKYTQEDLEFTAKKHGISVEEVKRRLGG